MPSTTTPETVNHTKRLLGNDRPGDLLAVVGVVATYLAIDHLTFAAAFLDSAGRFEPILLASAVGSSPLAMLALLALVGAAALVANRGGRSIWGGWATMEMGQPLRLFAAPVIAVLVWYGAAYDYNFWLERWHTADRLLLVALGVAALSRPIVLVPFALQARVLSLQFLSPLGAEAGHNIHDLGVLALVAIAATFIVTAAIGRRDTSAAVLVLATLVASHFFVPGRGKLGIDWLSLNTSPGDFARSSYTAGWLGAGSGGFTEGLASVLDRFRVPVILGTVVLEFAAFVAVVRSGLLRFWLAGWMVFHAFVFAASGFWLLEWVVVEASLLLLIVRPGQREWLARNHSPARAGLAVVLVVAAGGVIHHPPPLAWLDAPVAYGYEVEAVGESGAEYHVPLTAFSPVQQDISFLFAGLRPDVEAVEGYGAAPSVWMYEQLLEVSSVEELRALEQSLQPTPEATIRTSEELVLKWLDHQRSETGNPWFLPTAPSRYWNSRPLPTFAGEEPLREVTVVLVTTLHHVDGGLTDRTPVMTATIDDTGEPVVSFRLGDGDRT